MIEYLLFWLALFIILASLIAFGFICLLALGAFVTFKEWLVDKRVDKMKKEL
jgi:hypothetical protein